MINRYEYDEEFEQLTESLIYLNEDEGEPGFFASIWGKVSGYFSGLWNKTSTEAEGAKVSGSDEGIIAKFLNGFRNKSAKEALIAQGKKTQDSLKMGDGNDSALGAFLVNSIKSVEAILNDDTKAPSLWNIFILTVAEKIMRPFSSKFWTGGVGDGKGWISSFWNSLGLPKEWHMGATVAAGGLLAYALWRAYKKWVKSLKVNEPANESLYYYNYYNPTFKSLLMEGDDNQNIERGDALDGITSTSGSGKNAKQKKVMDVVNKAAENLNNAANLNDPDMPPTMKKAIQDSNKMTRKILSRQTTITTKDTYAPE